MDPGDPEASAGAQDGAGGRSAQTAEKGEAGRRLFAFIPISSDFRPPLIVVLFPLMDEKNSVFVELRKESQVFHYTGDNFIHKYAMTMFCWVSILSVLVRVLGICLRKLHFVQEFLLKIIYLFISASSSIMCSFGGTNSNT